MNVIVRSRRCPSMVGRYVRAIVRQYVTSDISVTWLLFPPAGNATRASSGFAAGREPGPPAVGHGGDELMADRVLPVRGNAGGKSEYDVIDALVGKRRDSVRAMGEVAGDDQLVDPPVWQVCREPFDRAGGGEQLFYLVGNA